MRSGLLFALVLCGCATPASRVSFEELTRATPRVNVTAATQAFLTSAEEHRTALPMGASMPATHASAWTTLLDATDQFLGQPADAAWSRDAAALRLLLETELGTDAQRFGDVPAEIAGRVPRTLQRLTRRLQTLSSRSRPVDPRRFRWPVEPLVVSSPYGHRFHPIMGEPRFHAGVDLEVPMGQPVYAASAGTVIFSAWNGAHGRQIELMHDAHWSTRYSHLEELLVKPGTPVKKGQLIGLAGASGLATGPHVHFELRRDGDALDPEAFLPPPPSLLLSERP